MYKYIVYMSVAIGSLYNVRHKRIVASGVSPRNIKKYRNSNHVYDFRTSSDAIFQCKNDYRTNSLSKDITINIPSLSRQDFSQ